MLPCLTRDPYNEGWIYMLEPVNWMAEMKSFFMGEPYGEWLKAEFTQLEGIFCQWTKNQWVSKFASCDAGWWRDYGWGT